MAKIKRYQIEATIEALNSELEENQIKLDGLMALKAEGVYMLAFRDEVGDSYVAIDERISAIDETIADTKTNLDLFNKLLESYYC